MKILGISVELAA